MLRFTAAMNTHHTMYQCPGSTHNSLECLHTRPHRVYTLPPPSGRGGGLRRHDLPFAPLPRPPSAPANPPPLPRLEVYIMFCATCSAGLRGRCASPALPSTHPLTHPHRIAVYVVFGATGGIGSALAARLALHPDAKLVLVGRDQGKLDALLGSLGGANSKAVTADVTDPKQVGRDGVGRWDVTTGW
eukprot:112350-Chlamydomonas_euryale.AAC.1